MLLIFETIGVYVSLGTTMAKPFWGLFRTEMLHLNKKDELAISR